MKKLLKLIRDHKSKCDNSEIYSVITSIYAYHSAFTFETFNTKRARFSDGTTFHSCIISKTQYGSCRIIHYDGLTKYDIEVFPSEIKSIVYKT